MAHNWQLVLPLPKPSKIIIFYWHKPPSQWVKINTDGSYCHSTKLAAIGGVIMDKEGRMLKGFQSFIGMDSIIYAKFVGIWQGLHR